MPYIECENTGCKYNQDGTCDAPMVEIDQTGECITED